jgi:hypothetical protein
MGYKPCAIERIRAAVGYERSFNLGRQCRAAIIAHNHPLFAVEDNDAHGLWPEGRRHLLPRIVESVCLD